MKSSESTRNPHRLASVAWRTVGLVWSSCPGLLTARLSAACVHGMVPIGLVFGAKMVVDKLQATRSLSDAVPWLIGITVLSILGGLLRHVGQYAASRMSDVLKNVVQLRVLRHATELDLAFFEDRRQQDALTRVRLNGSRACEELISQLIELGRNALQLIAMVIVIAWIEPLVLLSLAMLALPYGIALWRLSQSQYWLEHRRVHELRQANYLSGKLTNHSSVPEVRLLNLAPLLLDRIARLFDQFAQQNRALQRKRLLVQVCFASLAGVVICLLAFRTISKALSGLTTYGSVVAFLMATDRIFRAASGFAFATGRCAHTVLKVADLHAFYDTDSAPHAPERRAIPAIGTDPDTPRAGAAALELKDVAFTYAGAKRRVLKGVNLRVEPGEIVALVGSNGAGKSTLVKLLGRLYQPDSGSILVNGRELDQFTDCQLASHVSFLLQAFGKYETTVTENIAFGDWRRLLDEEEAVRRIAVSTGVADIIDQLPESYRTRLGRSFGSTTLSGGQWRTLAFARACARDVPLLVLDEPTTGLDPETEHRLLRFLREFLQGKSALVISHRFSTVRSADRIVVLEDGRIVETGTHDELLQRDGRYARLFKVRYQMLTTNPLTMAELG